jgi:hypothetical protein
MICNNRNMQWMVRNKNTDILLILVLSTVNQNILKPDREAVGK